MTGLPQSWSKAEVAEAWGISPKAIDRLVKAGRVGYFQAGRSRRFFAEHVAQLRAALEVDAAPPAPVLAGLTRQSSARRRSA